jgi:adenosylhomocysteine nucleosidase
VVFFNYFAAFFDQFSCMTRRRALIIAALPIEVEAILSFFENVEMKSTPNGVSYMTGNRKIFSSALGEKLKESWTFFIGSPTGAGNLEMSRALSRMIPACTPNLVALLGCAGGFPGKIDLFDVVAPPRVDYLARTKVAAKTEYRPQQEVCSSVFIDHCKNVQLLDLWHQYLLPDVANAPIDVLFEPLISGETVLTNSRSTFFRAVNTNSPKAVAIEMEGFGFLVACREHKVDGAVLRGISDTLDNKNDPRDDGSPSNLGPDTYQFKATRHAAALFFATIDFVHTNAFRDEVQKPRIDVTEVSIILDADLHDVSEVQGELLDLFKKYGIRHFSFRPANSIRVGFEAQADAMRIYKALVVAGIVKRLGRFSVLDFQVKHPLENDPLTPLLDRIHDLRGASVDDVLQIIRLENWIEHLPLQTRIVLDALEYQRTQDQTSSPKRAGRILHPVAPEKDAGRKHFFGPPATPVIVLTDPGKLRAALAQWTPQLADNRLLTWFMGRHLLDRDVPLDALISHSRQRMFYSWPGMGLLHAACNLTEKAFIDGALAEWDVMGAAAKPSLLHMLDQGATGRLSRRQIRDAIAGQPATLTKSVDLLSLTGRILSQNGLPASGCIIPSLQVLAFNGVIAGDGTVERMLLTGMAGDLAEVARRCDLPLPAIRSAIRGNTLPLRAAVSLASDLADTILSNSRLNVSSRVLDAELEGGEREAIVLPRESADRYLQP